MRVVVLLFSILMFTNCYETERHCSDFKTGTFEFSYTLDGVKHTSTFKRTEKYNIDYHNGTVDSSSVRWINDCEFILKKLHPSNNSEKDAIHMKILSTSQDSYTFEYKLAVKRPNRPLNVEKGTAVKIK
ncbi:hypothetical protein HNV08_08910 [Winogradskyella eckloniae]|uniref:hypothetical protein n=1 Tax=Winogradskyella eckloniae TaxID=1089306 RepID=UPI0015655077|nr:hypothetical protein [Winogradskyella eckloniae]NRD20168.1 hypothetical protein [Winogradskyella eckloniae]